MLMSMFSRLGLDPKLLASIMGSATGRSGLFRSWKEVTKILSRCWSVDTYNPCPGVIDNVPSSNDYRGGFGTALMTKVLVLSKFCHCNNVTGSRSGARCCNQDQGCHTAWVHGTPSKIEANQNISAQSHPHLLSDVQSDV